MITNMIRTIRIANTYSPVTIFWEITLALLILFGGKTNFIFTFGAMSIYQLSLPNAQIDYLIPITDEEIKKQSIINVFIIAVESIFLFIIGTIISYYLYDFKDIILENKAFIGLWAICIFFNCINNGLNIVSDRLTGILKESVMNQIKKDKFGILVTNSANIVMIALSYHLMEIYFLGKTVNIWLYEVNLTIMSVIMVFLVIGIIRKYRNIYVGDYYEIF